MVNKFVELSELSYESYHTPGRAKRLCSLLVVVDDIKKAVLGRGSCGRPHDEIVRVQVLEKVDSAGAKLWLLCAWVNAHLLVPVALHDNLLWFVAQLVQEHGLDDAVVDEDL